MTTKFEFPKGINVSQCVFCIHKKRGNFCDAFPDTIPPEILNNEFIHNQKHEQQTNEIVFETDSESLPEFTKID